MDTTCENGCESRLNCPPFSALIGQDGQDDIITSRTASLDCSSSLSIKWWVETDETYAANGHFDFDTDNLMGSPNVLIKLSRVIL